MIRGLVLSTCAAIAATQASVKDCAAGTSIFTVSSVTFSPLNPAPGTNGTMTTTYTVPATVEAGSTHYACVLNGIPIWSETYDLCTQTACPITAGVHTDNSISEIPDVSGKLVCTIDWKNTAGEELMCLQMQLKLAAPALRGANKESKALIAVPQKN